MDINSKDSLQASEHKEKGTLKKVIWGFAIFMLVIVYTFLLITASLYISYHYHFDFSSSGKDIIQIINIEEDSSIQ